MTLFLLLTTPALVNADNNYLIQTPQVNINQDQPRFNRGPTPSPAPITSIIETGSKTSNSKEPFVLSVSQDLIDFGILSPTDPITRRQTISISKGIALGYALFAWEDHVLQDLKTSEFIPDTTCDNGACTNKIFAPWESVLTYGFGFSLGDGYKRFANASEPEAIIQGLYSQSVKMLYKVNIAGGQKPGRYQNTVTLLAVPNF